MDEQEISSTNETNQEEPKNGSNEIEVDVCDVSMETDPAPTSTIDMSMMGESSEKVQVDETVPSEILEDEVAEKTQDISMADPDISTQIGDQSIMNYTEKSVNISQFDIDQQADESTDAFDALKQSESDALVATNEEIEEHQRIQKIRDQESDNSNDGEKSMDKDVSTQSVGDVDSDHNMDEPTKSVESETRDAGTQDDENSRPVDDEDVPPNQSTSDDVDFNSIQDDPEPELEPEPEDEGKGIDENVRLLSDEVEVADDDENVEINQVSQSALEDIIELSDSESPVIDDEKVDEPDEYEEDEQVQLKENEICEFVGEEATCLNCETATKCVFKVLEESGEIRFLCTQNCVTEHRDDNPDKYTLSIARIPIFNIKATEQLCCICNETKSCNYRVNVKTSLIVTTGGEEEGSEITEKTVENDELKFMCTKVCVSTFIGENIDKYIIKELKKTVDIKSEDDVPKFVPRSDAEVEFMRVDREQSFIRRCAQCMTDMSFMMKQNVQWELLDFCNLSCLGLYQRINHGSCSKCDNPVPAAVMGKLGVRFGDKVQQFCSKECLNEFKSNFQPCSVCSLNLKNREGMTQIFQKGSHKFCSRKCVRRYDEIMRKRVKHPARVCSVCSENKVPEIFVYLDGLVHKLCSEPCFSAFKFVNNVNTDECDMCKRFFERKSANAYTYFESSQNSPPKIFCTNECYSVFILKNREILQCDWCKVSKYNFDLISTEFDQKKICSCHCDTLREKPKTSSSSGASCSNCDSQKPIQYTLEMSDSSTRSFCAYQCVLTFQSSFIKARQNGEFIEVTPKGTAKRVAASQISTPSTSIFNKWAKPTPVTTTYGYRGRGRPPKQTGPYNPIVNKSNDIPVPQVQVILERLEDVPSRARVKKVDGKYVFEPRGPSPPPVIYEHKTQVVTIPPCPKEIRNKSTMCKALTLNKGINCVPETAEAECQTDEWLEKRYFVPIPVPIFIPQPMMMYSLPTVHPVPFPLPIPVPVFIPTTRGSAPGIMKEIKKIQDKMPTDPYEAELLMMAEMVAGESKKREDTDSESDENDMYGDGMDNNASFNEDLVQMAFKMASGNDYDENPVDLESEMTANTIASSPYGSELDHNSMNHHQLMLLQQQQREIGTRGRKRAVAPVKSQNSRAAPNKRIKREMEVIQEMQPAEKPDAHLCLKYTFGVNAWKQWVTTKNAEFEKSSMRRKPIKSEILQLTADELNYSLCMFVKEVRKPNGSEYAPDTIYYLVLGIQQYLYENGRIDNIFTDRFYESFTDCLDEVAKKFSILYNDSQYIVTRVEEEHLWECKQLGAHSPHVLLSTLMFFNTKHFNLVTVDEHMELSFSHIMKHWKRNPNQTTPVKTPGSRNVLLRFYPPQSALANSRKKKVYEQQENEDNPLRCPVKLYEFYLSKCPESVKTRNDVFYLQPERSCVPDSPVWYSTQALSREALSKMLHRVKMVKEINIALLTS